MRDQFWLDSIARDGKGDWYANALVKNNRNITKKQILFTSIPGQVINFDDPYNTIRTRVRPFTWHNIALAQPLLYPHEILDCYAASMPISDKHTIYRIDEEEQVYIPAALLIRALFMGSKLLNSHLFIPGAVDLLGAVGIEDERLVLMGSRAVSSINMTGRIARLLTWMLTDDEGRHAHASVLQYARKGIIDMNLPRISISGWMRGIEVEAGILAMELTALDIRFPIAHSEITFHVGAKRMTFPSYEPPVKSPWSISKRKQGRENLK